MGLSLGIALVEQLFSDGIGSIVIVGGTVRLDFMAFSPLEKDANGQPKAVHQQRIVMGAEAFLHSAAKIQEAAQALSKLGTAARSPGEPRVVEAPPRPSAEPRVVEPSAPSPPSEQSAPTPPKRPFP